MYINRHCELWDHTIHRIVEAEKKSNGDYDKFAKMMVTRLKRITHEEKIHYAIAALRDRGHNEIVDVYEGKLVMNELVRSFAVGGF